MESPLNALSSLNPMSAMGPITVRTPQEKEARADKLLNVGGTMLALGAGAEVVKIGRMAITEGAFEGQDTVAFIPKMAYQVATTVCEGYNYVVDQVVGPVAKDLVETMHIHSQEAPEKALLLTGFIGAGLAICGIASKISSRLAKKNQPTAP